MRAKELSLLQPLVMTYSVQKIDLNVQIAKSRDLGRFEQFQQVTNFS